MRRRPIGSLRVISPPRLVIRPLMRSVAAVTPSSGKSGTSTYISSYSRKGTLPSLGMPSLATAMPSHKSRKVQTSACRSTLPGGSTYHYSTPRSADTNARDPPPVPRTVPSPRTKLAHQLEYTPFVHLFYIVAPLSSSARITAPRRHTGRRQAARRLV